MRAQRGSLLCLLVVGGCATDDPAQLAWRVAVGSDIEAEAVAYVRTEIRVGGCLGSVITYASTTAKGETHADVPALSPGTYGFAAIAIDAGCNVLAEDCRELVLPATTAEVVLDLVPASTRPACVTCRSDCSDTPTGTSDHDASDGALDGGVADATSTDASSIDSRAPGTYPCGSNQCRQSLDGCIVYDDGSSRCFPIGAGCQVNVITGGGCPCVGMECTVLRMCTVHGDWNTVVVQCGDPSRSR